MGRGGRLGVFWPLTRRTCSRELQSDVNFCLHVVIPHQSAGWRCASCRAPSSSSITPATVNGRIILLLVVDWEAPPPQLPPPTASAPMTACICETHRDYKVVWMTICAKHFQSIFGGGLPGGRRLETLLFAISHILLAWKNYSASVV